MNLAQKGYSHLMGVLVSPLLVKLILFNNLSANYVFTLQRLWLKKRLIQLLLLTTLLMDT